MSCCTKIIDLGCASNCSNVDTGLTIANGEYSIVAYYESQISFSVDITGGTLIIPTSYLSESRAVLLKVFDANGDIVIFEVDNIEYDCLQIKINYQIDVTIPS